MDVFRQKKHQLHGQNLINGFPWRFFSKASDLWILARHYSDRIVFGYVFRQMRFWENFRFPLTKPKKLSLAVAWVLHCLPKNAQTKSLMRCSYLNSIHLPFCSDDDGGPSGGSPPKQLKPSTSKPSMAVPSASTVEGNEERMNSKKKRIRPDVIGGGGGGGSKTTAATPSDQPSNQQQPLAAIQRKFEPCHLPLLFHSQSGLTLCDFTWLATHTWE